MAGVNADPEKLKQFGKTLSSSADQLQQIARNLARALESAQWKDPEGQKFEQEFKHSLRNLTQFAEQSKSQYAPRLQKKVAALEQYRGS
jgi:hypothetical protein